MPRISAKQVTHLITFAGLFLFYVVRLNNNHNRNNYKNNVGNNYESDDYYNNQHFLTSQMLNSGSRAARKSEFLVGGVREEVEINFGHNKTQSGNPSSIRTRCTSSARRKLVLKYCERIRSEAEQEMATGRGIDDKVRVWVRQVRYSEARMAGIGNSTAEENKLRSTNDELEKYALILSDDVHKVLYCAVPKAASTTWKTVFARATRHDLAHPASHEVENARFMAQIGLHFLHTYSRSEIHRRLKTYFKFLVVRHPLDRLVSAYRDKVARWNSYGVFIRSKIMATALARNTTTAFHKTLIEAARDDSHDNLDIGIRAHYAADSNSQRRFGKISFRDFARYVIEESDANQTLDHHWSNYDHLCNPCDINYDFIAKVETMQTDARVILSILGINGYNTNRRPFPNINHNKSQSEADVNLNTEVHAVGSSGLDLDDWLPSLNSRTRISSNVADGLRNWRDSRGSSKERFQDNRSELRNALPGFKKPEKNSALFSTPYRSSASQERYLHEFKGLSLDERKKLAAIYQRDMDMFGYIWHDHSLTTACAYDNASNETCC